MNGIFVFVSTFLVMHWVIMLSVSVDVTSPKVPNHINTTSMVMTMEVLSNFILTRYLVDLKK